MFWFENQFFIMKKNDKNTEKRPAREKTSPEKYWDSMIKTYFTFFSRRFQDEDGYPLSPTWNDQKRGMEAAGLKGIVKKLRENAEKKNITWDEATAISHLHNFLQKAYNIPFIKKSMMCCVMNKFFDMVMSSTYTPVLVDLVKVEWYELFPAYVRDEDRDNTASQIIIGFLKQQFLQKNIPFSNDSVMQTVRIIFRHVKADDWWSKKTLRSVANNLQEFVTKIKQKQDARAKAGQPTDQASGEWTRSDERVAAIAGFSIARGENIRPGADSGNEDQRRNP